MRFHTGCRGGGGGRRIDQNIGLATFVCSSDLNGKFQLKIKCCSVCSACRQSMSITHA